MMFAKFAVPVVIGALAILPAACAPQPSEMASPPSAASLSGPANATTAAQPMQGMSGMDHSSTPGMAGMDHSSMQGMDMNTMMAHCSQMRQGMRPGMAMNADMRQMMSECDQMDHSMGMSTPRSR